MSLPKGLLEDIARGAPLDPGALLGPLGATAVSERASANAELAQALFDAGRAGDADPFAERAFVLSGFAERFLPLYVEIQKALGRVDRVCAAYRRAGMNLAAAGKTEEAIGLFSLSHLAFVHAGLGDRYEYDFEIQRSIEDLARKHRPREASVRAQSGAGPIRIAYLVFGAHHRGSALIKHLCDFAAHHDRPRFDVRFYVPESPRTPRHAPHAADLRTNIALLEANGARVEAASAQTELECWLETDRRIRDFGADVLVTTALLAHYSHFFIAAMRPARAIVGLGLGPPEQYAAPGLDWVVCATRHPLMDMPCDASVVEFETSPPDRDAIRPAPRSSFEVPEGAPLVVVAGRPQKFLDRNYWTALSQILVENPAAYLLALGPNDEPPFLGEVLAPDARRRFRRLGWSADYLPLLANADVVMDTYPSGGGFVLTDAMALGIPVVTFRNDYLRPFDQTEWSPGEEFVNVEGLVVPRGDFGELRRVLGRLIADAGYRREMGESCRADLLANRSDPGRMVRRHEEIYERVMEKTAGRRIEPGLSRAPAPLVSIVIPVYNGADFLREAIDSALAQTYPNVEVLVVNDGSTDGGATEAIAKSYGGRIRYFSKPNGHVASALNFGIRHMAGAYFSWLSHDDLYKPEKIAAQMVSMQTLGDDTVVYGDFEILEQASGAFTPVRLPDVPSAHFRHYLTLNSAVHGCTLLIPKRCLDACGQFDESLKTTQDYDLWFRLARRCRFVHVPGIVVTSRHHAAQGTIALKDVATVECDRLRVGFVRALSDGEVEAAAGTSAPRAYFAMAAALRALGFSEARSAALERARAAAGRRSRLARFALEAEAALSIWARPRLARLRRWIG